MKAPPDYQKAIKKNGVEKVLGMDSSPGPKGTTKCPAPKRLLRSADEGSKSIREVSVVLGIPDLAACILRYAKNNGLTGPKGLPESLRDLQRCSAQRFKMLQVLVLVFQDPDSYNNHNLRCTGSEFFRGAAARNDPVLVNVGEDVMMTGDLGGRLPAFLRGLLKLRGGHNNSYRFAVVEVLWPINNGSADPCDTLIWVQRRVYKSAMGGIWVINIRSIMGMAHLVPYGEGRWLVNNRIDLKTWNDVYMGLRNAV